MSGQELESEARHVGQTTLRPADGGNGGSDIKACKYREGAETGSPPDDPACINKRTMIANQRHDQRAIDCSIDLYGRQGEGADGGIRPPTGVGDGSTRGSMWEPCMGKRGKGGGGGGEGKVGKGWNRGKGLGRIW